MKIVKRNGTLVEYDGSKIVLAIQKAMSDEKEHEDKYPICVSIEHSIFEDILESNKIWSIEDISDSVETKLMENGLFKVAKSYVLYRGEQSKKRKSGWEMTELQRDIYTQKYKLKTEDFDMFLERVSGGNQKLKKIIRDKKFLFGGRILANRKLNELENRKITLSNCYVITPPEDNLESIFDTAKKLARTYSYGGGCGIDISKLRPNGAKVYNNAVTTSGAVSFMELYSTVTGLIGQKGRRGALMISINSSHPDLEEFIDIKSNLDNVTKANISIFATDAFLSAVEKKETYNTIFVVKDTEEIIKKEVDAYGLFNKLAFNSWDVAEPAILFKDRIDSYHLLQYDEDFEFAGVNPCAEEPLPAGGSCLLGSINLEKFVINQFQENARFDMEDFLYVVEQCVIGLNEVLDEGLPLHPLEEQKESVKDLRQIGLGVMGIADMLIKLGIRYGSEESLELCDKIAWAMADRAIRTSSLLAKEFGTYKSYKKEAILKSDFLLANTSEETFNLVKENGIRNSQLLTIAPTGSLSTMLGISGGIEPIFNTSYTRKTQTLNDGEDTYYKVYTPIVKEVMDAKGASSEEELSDILVTAMTLKPIDRIKMQSIWQKHIDASISSTVNLHNDATVQDVEQIYLNAWKYGLKGITVYRDGCRRGGILLNTDESLNEVDYNNMDSNEIEEQIKKLQAIKANKTENKTPKCPECGGELNFTNGCKDCQLCGWSACSI